MYRNTLVTLVVLVGSAALATAQPYRYYPPPTPPTSLAGVWYYNGDPSLPCLIQAASGPYGVPRAIFTNERGSQSSVRILPGNRVVADDWDGLLGHLDRDGDAIFWANGSVWRR